MDSNPNTQAPINTPPAAPQAAPAQPVINNGGNKKLWITLGLVVLIVAVGGISWYITSRQKVEPSPRPTPTAAPETVDTFEKDLDSITLDDLEKEFSAVDSDLQGL